MALKNSSNNNPFYNLEDEDDDIASAFMNSSSPTYLAADRLGPSMGGEREISKEECQRNELLLQMQQAEERTLDSSKRSLGMLIESEKIGIETAQDLSRQREQLSNTENRLDEINFTLKDTQKNINGIKSVFSSLKQWWTTPKKPTSPDGDAEPKSSPVSPSGPPPPDQKPLVLTKDLTSAVESSQTSLQSNKVPHPGMRIRGLEEDNDTPRFTSDFMLQSQRVNQRLDEDLESMSSGLSRLKNLAHGLGTEIEDQNSMIGRINNKADKADITISSQNSQIKRILKSFRSGF